MSEVIVTKNNILIQNLHGLHHLGNLLIPVSVTMPFIAFVVGGLATDRMI